MPIEIIHTDIQGLVLIKPHFFVDERGYFIKDFERGIFKSHDLPTDFAEMNESCSRKGTLRGLHLQTVNSQGKLVRVICGSVYDVVVDLRKDSPTFGEWRGFYLDDQNHNLLYIPPNFAHGFLTLAENTIFSYKCTDSYNPNYETGINWDDKTLNIDWPLQKIDNLTISNKDLALPAYLKLKEEIGE